MIKPLQNPTWFETHAHLSDLKFDLDRDEVIKRAGEKGVVHMLEIADGPSEWEKAQALAEKYPSFIKWAAGIHPYYADCDFKKAWDHLRTHTLHPHFVAVGEVGLDYAKCTIPKDTQKACFIGGIELALQINKPLIVHCREAFLDLIPLLRSFFPETHPQNAPSPGVIHCFSGGAEEALILIEMGFYLGVDGPLTYPNAHRLRETIAQIPLDKLVLETDSPYLPPQDYRGQRNEPAYLPLIGRCLAKVRSISENELAAQLTFNSFTLFRLN